MIIVYPLAIHQTFTPINVKSSILIIRPIIPLTNINYIQHTLVHLIVQTSFNNSFLRKSCLQSAANIVRTVNFVSGYKDIFCGLVLSLKSKFIVVLKQVYARLIISQKSHLSQKQILINVFSMFCSGISLFSFSKLLPLKQYYNRCNLTKQAAQ